MTGYLTNRLANFCASVLLAFPVAYYVSFMVRPEKKSLWLFLITVPFWTNLLIRTFALIGARDLEPSDVADAAIAGFTVLVAGLLMLVLPGPALIVIPMLKMQDYAIEGDRPATSGSGQGVLVVRGQVVNADAQPIRNAVVSVLTPDGEAIDWGQADSDGRFNAAIPAAADYLVVTSAEGWQPRSRMMHLDSAEPMPPIVLRGRLRLRGLITDGEGEPISDALVVLTRISGESVGSIRTEHDGSYEIPRPANGRYVLTVISPDGAIGARPVTVWEAARSVDLALGMEAGKADRRIRLVHGPEAVDAKVVLPVDPRHEPASEPELALTKGIVNKVFVNRGHGPGNPGYRYTEIQDIGGLPGVVGL